MDAGRPTAATHDGLLPLLCGCVLVELVFGRLVARAGFFIPKSGVAAQIYSAVALTGMAAFHASVVLTYLVVGWRACRRTKGRKQTRSASKRWEIVTTGSVVVLAMLGLVRLAASFGPAMGAVYQVVFVVALVSCTGAAFGHSSRRWWVLPMLFQLISQVCVKLFVVIENLADVDGRFSMGLYQTGELLLLASAWAFVAVALGRSLARDRGRSILRRPVVIVAGIASLLGGLGTLAICVYSPYPSQMIMFSGGITMSAAGPALWAASGAAAAFALALCLFGGDETRHTASRERTRNCTSLIRPSASTAGCAPATAPSIASRTRSVPPSRRSSQSNGRWRLSTRSSVPDANPASTSARLIVLRWWTMTRRKRRLPWRGSSARRIAWLAGCAPPFAATRKPSSFAGPTVSPARASTNGHPPPSHRTSSVLLHLTCPGCVG